MSSSRGAVARSEGDHHDAGFGVSTERNELVERGRREVGRVTITAPVSECRPSGMSSSSAGFGVSTERNELVERGRREVGG